MRWPHVQLKQTFPCLPSFLGPLLRQRAIAVYALPYIPLNGYPVAKQHTVHVPMPSCREEVLHSCARIPQRLTRGSRS